MQITQSLILLLVAATVNISLHMITTILFGVINHSLTVYRFYFLSVYFSFRGLIRGENINKHLKRYKTKSLKIIIR